jgi:hypothetical protein
MILIQMRKYSKSIAYCLVHHKSQYSGVWKKAAYFPSETAVEEASDPHCLRIPNTHPRHQDHNSIARKFSPFVTSTTDCVKDHIALISLMEDVTLILLQTSSRLLSRLQRSFCMFLVLIPSLNIELPGSFVFFKCKLHFSSTPEAFLFMYSADCA